MTASLAMPDEQLPDILVAEVAHLSSLPVDRLGCAQYAEVQRRHIGRTSGNERQYRPAFQRMGSKQVAEYPLNGTVAPDDDQQIDIGAQ